MSTNGQNEISKTLPDDVVACEPLYLSDLISRPRTLFRLDGHGDSRWYYTVEPVDFFISVTSLIQATTPIPYGLLQWIKTHGADADDMREERADYGTFLHTEIAELLIAGTYDLTGLRSRAETACMSCNAPASAKEWTRDAQNDLLAFAAFCQTHQVKPLAVEIMLASRLGYAGAIDLVCEMNIGTGANGNFLKRDGEGARVRALIDLKSGKKGFYENHEIQLHMYRNMWHENFPDQELRINHVFNWAPKDWRTTPSFTLKDQTDSEAAAKIPHLIDLFRASNISPGIKKVFGGQIDLAGDLSTCYQSVPIADYVAGRYSLTQKKAEA